jgi:hypothetical protein
MITHDVNDTSLIESLMLMQFETVSYCYWFLLRDLYYDSFKLLLLELVGAWLWPLFFYFLKKT